MPDTESHDPNALSGSVGPVARGVPRAVEKFNRRVGLLVGALVVLLLISSIGTGVLLYQSQQRIRILSALTAQSERTDCSLQLQADYDAAVGRAFAAPPAPSPERALAAEDIARASQRIHNHKQTCAHGTPNPLVPSERTTP